MRRALVIAMLAVAACVRPPARIAGEFPPVTVADAQQDDRLGERVRWGGVIVETTPGRDETCLQIVSLPLDRRARPRMRDETYGRFEACAPGFYDPEIYSPKREVTVVGTLDRPRRGKVGERDYVFPRVAAEAIYLWPERNEESRDYYGGYYGSYGGPFWYPYGWGWFGPAVVVHGHHHGH